MFSGYFSMLKKEFAGYNGARFSKDLMAGLTVTAVALPLALAFGVSSGADAAAGLLYSDRAEAEPHGPDHFRQRAGRALGGAEDKGGGPLL